MISKTIVRRYYEELLNNGDTSSIGDYEEVHNGVRYKLGIVGAREYIEGVWHVYLGMQPTGIRNTCTGVNVDRLKPGKIIEHCGAANLLIPLPYAGVIELK